MQKNTWLSEKEVAQLTGISVSTLQKNRFIVESSPIVRSVVWSAMP